MYNLHQTLHLIILRNTMKIMFGFLFVICTFLFSCSSTQVLKSTKSSSGFTLDGDNNDWDNNSFYDEGNDILLHFENDKEFLYIGFATDDIVKQAQILNMGFIVWFDKTGGSEKKLGIKFPLGKMGNFSVIKDPKEELPKDNRILNEEMDLVDSMTTIEIVKDENTKGKIRSLSELKGLWLNAKKYKGVYIYELKIAMYSKDNDVSINLKPGSTNRSIGIGFETVEPDMSKMKEKMPERKGDMPPPDMPEGKNQKRGMKPNMNTLKYWVSLDVAN